MKRFSAPFLTLAFTFLAFSLPARAQLGIGSELFQRPAISKVFHPVVGKGAVYQTTDNDKKTSSMEIAVVGKDSADGKDAYWMQVMHTGADGKTFVGKSLITIDDFQVRRAIVQMPGQQAMEMPMHMNQNAKNRTQDHMNDWHTVGTESVTVPAGTFSCDHWHNDKDGGDIWTSDKVVPFGMVKEVRTNGSVTVLQKTLDPAQDRITGPVKQFDMQQMMQEMQQRRQQSPQ